MAKKQTTDEFIRNIDRALRLAENQLRDFHMWAAKVTDEERQEAFKRHEGPDGEDWPALKQSTIESKRRKRKTTVQKRVGGISGLGQSKSSRAS